MPLSPCGAGTKIVVRAICRSTVRGNKFQPGFSSALLSSVRRKNKEMSSHPRCICEDPVHRCCCSPRAFTQYTRWSPLSAPFSAITYIYVTFEEASRAISDLWFHGLLCSEKHGSVLQWLRDHVVDYRAAAHERPGGEGSPEWCISVHATCALL